MASWCFEVSDAGATRAARRSWTSFGPKAGLVGWGATLAALLATTITAGLAVSADDAGRFIYLAVPVPNQPIESLRFWFYGWAYGLPVLICVTAFTVVTWRSMHASAIRPFRRPDTVAAERSARVEIADRIMGISAAGMLLALAVAWRFIARAGSAGQLTIDGAHSGTLEITWRYAEFASVAGFFAPILEVIASVILLLIAASPCWAASSAVVGETAEHSLGPEPAR